MRSLLAGWPTDWFIELTDDGGCGVGRKCWEGEQLTSRGEEEGDEGGREGELSEGTTGAVRREHS